MRIAGKAVNLLWLLVLLLFPFLGLWGGALSDFPMPVLLAGFGLLVLLALLSFSAYLYRSGDRTRAAALLGNGLAVLPAAVIATMGEIRDFPDLLALTGAISAGMALLNLVGIGRLRGSRPLRWALAWSTTGLVVLPAALVLLVGGLNNWLDEAPDPGVGALLETDPIPPEDNAYIHLLGMYAPEGRAAHDYGRERVRAMVEAMESGQGSPGPGGDELELQGDGAALCHPGDNPQGCRTLEPAAVAQAAAANRTLLQRYRRLLAYSDYQDVPVPTAARAARYYRFMRFPDFQRDLHRLYISQALVAARKEGPLAGIEDLHRDIRFWSMAAREAENLLSKLQAIAYLERDLAALSLLLEDGDLAAAAIAAAEKAVAEPGPQVLAMERAWRGEMRASIRILQGLADPEAFRAFVFRGQGWTGWLHTRLLLVTYQPGTTMNRAYRSYRDRRAIARMSGRELLGVLRNRDAGESFRRPAGMGWLNPIDLIGRGFAGIAEVSRERFAGYAAHPKNLAALRRLVALQVRIRQEGVSPDATAAFLQGSGRAYRNPYTGQPPRWDPDQRTLTFRVLPSDWNPEHPGSLTRRLSVRIGAR